MSHVSNAPVHLNQLQSHLKTHFGSSSTQNVTDKTKVTGSILNGIKRLFDHKLVSAPVTPAAPQAPAIVWRDEEIRLRNFYKHLHEHAKAEFVFQLCNHVIDMAENQINDISKYTTVTAEEMQQLKNKVILDTRESIGKIVFVFECEESKFGADIDLENCGDVMGFINGFTKNEFQDVMNQLEQKNTAANAFSLQDPNMVIYVEEPKEIAKILLTATGQLNLGLIPSLKEQFFPDDRQKLSSLQEYQQKLLCILDQLDTNWQQLIDSVEVPSGLDTVAHALVRADLGLLPTEEVTKIHCQQVVFGAILSQLCQGPVGDCFAVAWAIRKHDEFPLAALKDYIDIVRDGFLTRQVNGAPDHFFFEMTIADEAMASQITLKPSGSVDEFHAPFWACPNLIAACRQMGITDLDKRKDALLQKLFGSKADPLTLTWNDLIRACADDEMAKSHPEGDLFALGQYGFSLANNHLLRAWENCFAAMAEDRAGTYVRDNVVNSVMTVFDGVFTSMENKASSEKKTVIEKVKDAFQKTLNSSFRFLYNGAIPLTHVSSDGSSSSGGFELYERDLQDLTHKGVRIATPEEFTAFVQRCLAKTTVDGDRSVISSVLQSLALCANGKDFMKNVLYAYDDANQKVADPVGHYRDLERTPMMSLDGDNPWEVMSIDLGHDFSRDVKAYKPKNPQDLLRWLLGIAKWKEAKERYLEDNIANEEDSTTSPQHAFNIEMEGPEFKNFVTSKLSQSDWIKKTIVEPGSKIATAVMDRDAKQRFTTSVQNWLANQFQDGMPVALTQSLQKLFGSLNAKMTVNTFAKKGHDGVLHLFPQLNDDQKTEISLLLDGMLLQSLPADQTDVLQKSAVRFAKTNWDTGPDNLYFCCYFSPRTQQLAFGSIAEDQTGLQPMNEKEWIDGQQWEVDPLTVRD